MVSRRSWTASEVAWLTEQAGRVPLSQIARALGRSEMSVRHAAMRHGLSLRTAQWGLAWCPSCASWRREVRSDGRCLVCEMRAWAERDRERCEELLSRLPPERRAAYQAASSSGRGRVKPLPPRPLKPQIASADPTERQREQRRYALALENWELLCAKRTYNREKQRLKRLRQIANEDM